MPNWPRHLALGLALLARDVWCGWIRRCAQTKLKWAHVYEVSEPYHTQALWAAEEIKKRTNGRYEIGVFPASQLGNENQINEGLGLGTVDIIYTGTSFAGSIHKPLAISGAPFMLRDFNHWKAYRDSKLFRDIAKGYEDKTKHKIVALTYYGERMVTANKEIKKPEDMKGMKLRVPPAPLYLMLAKSVGANATPIAFAEVYLALQQGTVDGQENPLPTIMAKKFYEVQSHIMLTGHIVESLLTIVGSHVWAKLSDADKKVFEEVLTQAAAKASDEIRTSEQKIADQLRKLGKTVVVGRPRGLPQGGDPAAQRRLRRRRLVAGRIRRAAGVEVTGIRGDVPACRAYRKREVTDAVWARAGRMSETREVGRQAKQHLIEVEDAEVVDRASPGGLARLRAVLVARLHRLSAVLHALRAQRQPGLDRGNRALCADVGRVHRRRDGDAPQHAYRRRTAVERDEAGAAARGAAGLRRFRQAGLHRPLGFRSR